MMKATRWTIFPIALLFLATPAAIAQATVEGWYAEVGGGLSLVSDIDVDRLGSGFNIDSDVGYMVSGAFGKQFRNVHVELEAIFSENELNELSGTGTGTTMTGDLRIMGAMANVYYDFDFGRSWRPFVGGGIGLARISLKDASAPGFFSVDDDDDVVAYQLRAGISYSLSAHTDFIVNYRYFVTDDLDFGDSTGTVVSSGGIDSHGVEARFRIRF